MSREDRSNQEIRLRDGRTLTFAEYGSQRGAPMLFFHGGNDSRLEAAIFHRDAREIGVRVIAPDRPGFGRSDHKPGRRLIDWPNDVAELADALLVDDFAVAGHSGGGPHAAAVAHALPSRCTMAALIASPAPAPSSNRGLHPLFRFANLLMRVSPTLNRRLQQRWADQVLDTPDRFFQQWGRISPADGALFKAHPEIREMIETEMREVARNGIEGILQEHRLYRRSWGLDLADITTAVDIWHGLADRQAAPSWSAYLANHIPNAKLKIVPGAGHFSTLAHRRRDILERARDA
jgi:pimeloyl-ACP methyl ester carboxylesterase